MDLKKGEQLVCLHERPEPSCLRGGSFDPLERAGSFLNSLYVLAKRSQAKSPGAGPTLGSFFSPPWHDIRSNWLPPFHPFGRPDGCQSGSHQASVNPFAAMAYGLRAITLLGDRAARVLGGRFSNSVPFRPGWFAADIFAGFLRPGWTRGRVRRPEVRGRRPEARVRVAEKPPRSIRSNAIVDGVYAAVWPKS